MCATSMGLESAHSPVPGERKSGMPDGTEMPAPDSATTVPASRTSRATPSRVTPESIATQASLAGLTTQWCDDGTTTTHDQSTEGTRIPMTPFDDNVAAAQRFMDSERFAGVTRLYSARQVAEQQGTIPADCRVARENAAAFYARLRELFAEKKSITTFGPYSPSQAVTHEADGHRGHLPGRLGHLGQGQHHRGPGRRPGELPAVAGA